MELERSSYDSLVSCDPSIYPTDDKHLFLLISFAQEVQQQSYQSADVQPSNTPQHTSPPNPLQSYCT
jgi:hypothetical protein